MRAPSGFGGDFAGGGMEAGCGKALVDVQLARAAVVVEAVRHVGGLLSFKQDDAGADGVHGAGIDEDHVAFFDWNLLDHGFERVVGDGLSHGFHAAARLEPERHRRARPGVEHVPALRLAAGLSGLLGQRVIGVYLYGKLVVGKQYLHQQRVITCFIAMRSEQCIGIGRGKLAERASLLIAGLDEALRTGEPGFTDRLGRAVVVPGGEVARAPRPGAEKGRDAKGCELRRLHIVHRIA